MNFIIQACSVEQNIDIKHLIEKEFSAHPDSYFCDDFRLTVSDVTNFLSAAREVTEQHFFNELDWTPCYADVVIKKEGFSFMVSLS